MELHALGMSGRMSTTLRAHGKNSGAVELQASDMPSWINTTRRAHGKSSVATQTYHGRTELDCTIDADRNSRVAWGRAFGAGRDMVPTYNVRQLRAHAENSHTPSLRLPAGG